jgi:hypothetical protein
MNIIYFELLKPRLFFFRKLLLLNTFCLNDFLISANIIFKKNFFFDLTSKIFFKRLTSYSFVIVDSADNDNNKLLLLKKPIVQKKKK